MHEDTLAHVELFAGLEKKDLQLLAGACRERKYRAGSKLIKQGDTGVGLYVITNGTVHSRIGSRHCWSRKCTG